jgi:hypothetical protein
VRGRRDRQRRLAAACILSEGIRLSECELRPRGPGVKAGPFSRNGAQRTGLMRVTVFFTKNGFISRSTESSSPADSDWG